MLVGITDAVRRIGQPDSTGNTRGDSSCERALQLLAYNVPVGSDQQPGS